MPGCRFDELVTNLTILHPVHGWRERIEEGAKAVFRMPRFSASYARNSIGIASSGVHSPKQLMSMDNAPGIEKFKTGRQAYPGAVSLGKQFNVEQLYNYGAVITYTTNAIESST